MLVLTPTAVAVVTNLPPQRVPKELGCAFLPQHPAEGGLQVEITPGRPSRTRCSPSARAGLPRPGRRVLPRRQGARRQRRRPRAGRTSC